MNGNTDCLSGIDYRAKNDVGKNYLNVIKKQRNKKGPEKSEPFFY